MITPKSDCEQCKGAGLVADGTCPCVRNQELVVRIKQAVARHGRLFERTHITTPKTRSQEPARRREAGTSGSPTNQGRLARFAAPFVLCRRRRVGPGPLGFRQRVQGEGHERPEDP